MLLAVAAGKIRFSCMRNTGFVVKIYVRMRHKFTYCLETFGNYQKDSLTLCLLKLSFCVCDILQRFDVDLSVEKKIR